MTSATEAFFNGLARRQHEPILEKVSGTVRFDLDHGRSTDHWFVTIKDGDVSVMREGPDADAVFYAPAPVFEKMASGEMNGMAAILRGEVAAVGNLELGVLLQRLLPGPPSSSQPSRVSRSAAAKPENVRPGVPRATTGYPTSRPPGIDTEAPRIEESRHA